VRLLEVARLGEGKKRVGADLAACYGVGALSLPAEQQYALWLMIPRARLQRSADVCLGVLAAAGSGELPRAWADALAAFPEQVDAEHWRLNAERGERDLLRRRR
jgi:hypothetical protein